jgi:hypothetical protein
MQIAPDDFARVQLLSALVTAVQQWAARRAALDAAMEAIAESERDLLELGKQLAAFGRPPIAAPGMTSSAAAPGAPTVTMPIAPAAPAPAPTSNEKPADEVVLDWMRGNPQAVTP